MDFSINLYGFIKAYKNKFHSVYCFLQDFLLSIAFANW